MPNKRKPSPPEVKKQIPQRLRGIVASEGDELLTDMERLTWKEIWSQQTGGRRRGAKHKFIPIENLCEDAQRRLDELGLLEWGRLFRFRTGNMERLWGLVSEEEPRVFYPIWWDPAHKVCPMADRD